MSLNTEMLKLGSVFSFLFSPRSCFRSLISNLSPSYPTTIQTAVLSAQQARSLGFIERDRTLELGGPDRRIDLCP
jgi:hypothetical protein